MTTTIDDIHAWFRENLESFITGGLMPEERRQVEAHAAICAACEVALAEAKGADAALRDLFGFVAPAAGFEDNLLAGLRGAPVRPWRIIPPALRRLAVGVAAVIVVGGFGLVGNRMMQNGKSPRLALPELPMPTFAWLDPNARPVKVSSNLRQVGQAVTLSANEDHPADMRTYAVRDLLRPESDAIISDLSLLSTSTGGDVNGRAGGGGGKDGGDHGRGDATTPSNGPEGKRPASESLAWHAPNTWELQTPTQLAETSVAQVHAGFEFAPAATVTTGKPVTLAGVNHYTGGTVINGGTLSLGGQVLTTDGDALTDHGITQLGNTVATPLSVNVGQSAKGAKIDTYALDVTKTGTGTLALKSVNGQGQGLGYSTDSLGDKTEAKPGGMYGSNSHDYYGYVDATRALKAPEALYFQPSATAIVQREAELKQLPQVMVKDMVTELSDQSVASGDVRAGRNLHDSAGTAAPADAVKVLAAGEKTGVADPSHKDSPSLELFAEGVDAKGKPAEAPADAQAGAPKPAAPELPPAVTPTPPPPLPATAQANQRKIIRNGQMEFEVDSFDSSFLQIGKIVAEEGGFVASTDSEKLPNGKVKGTVTVRCPPDRLDVLVLKLRGLGDLRTQRIAAQDITKQYTDLESGLRAARTMEERLLDIIKNGKGTVKDLVEAEKQLGTYREKIEQIEGELRYYANLVSLSTLNVTLYERDLKTPSAAFESEQVQAGIETEDVEKARADAIKAIDDAKGRIIESNLKKLDAGQLTATIVAEVSPDAAGPLTDRLKQLGKVVRLEAERKQTTQGGTGAPNPSVKMERRATRFNISLYNLANIAPRETVNITLAAADVETAYRAILNAMRGEIGEAANKLGDITPIGRVVSSSLVRPKPDQTTGALSLEVRADQANALEAVIRGLGDVMNLTVTENPDQNNVTRAKRGYSVSLISIAQVEPREAQTLDVAAKNVPATYNKLLSALQGLKPMPARILSSQLNEQDRQNVTGQAIFEVPRAGLPAVEAALGGGGSGDSEVYSRNVTRSPDTQNTLDSKVRLTVTLAGAETKPPREATTIAAEVADVEKALNDIVSTTETSGGRIVDRLLVKQQNGYVGAHVVVDVPLTAAPATLDRLTALGTVRKAESSKNPQVPAGPLARARFDVTLGSPAPIVSPEDGVGASFRKGLHYSLSYLAYSLMLIVIGVCLVGPFALLIWAGWRVARRGRTRPAATPGAAA